MYKNINDYELLYLIAEKDEDAYNSICTKYSNMVKIHANRIYRNSKYLGISYEDIYQAGLYGLTMAIKNFDENQGVLFYTCASTFITREMITFVRKNNRHKHNVLSDSFSLDTEIDADGTIMLDFIENKNNNIKKYYENDEIDKILDFKYKLPFMYSLIYELRLNNFTNQEIAVLLGVKYKFVDNALMTIKDKLKKELNKIEVLLWCDIIKSVKNMGNKETLRQYFVYNKDFSEVDQIFYNLNSQLKYLHSRGYCVAELNSDTILLDTNKNNSPTNHSEFSFSMIVRTQDPQKDFAKNIKDLSKLAIGAFISIENGFCDYSKLDAIYINKYFDEMADFIPNSEYFRNVIINNDTTMYYSDFVNNKNSNAKSNSMQKLKATEYGKMYVPDEEKAFVRIVFYPVLIITVIAVVAIISKLL